MIETHFGWLPHGERTGEQIEAHERAVGEMPKFATPSDSAGKRAVLWDAAKKVNAGRHFPALTQATGACVGYAATAAVWYLAAVDAVVRGDRERVVLPFVGYHYGRGRMHSGIRGRGDGSLGSGQAKAVRVDGILPSDADGLPRPSGASPTWGSSVERQWSDGAAISSKWIDAGNDHPVQTTALITSYEQARDALVNGYPVMVCSNVGFEGTPLGPGFGRVDKGKRWGVRGGTWNHATCFIGVDDSSSRPGLCLLNSWGLDAHGTPEDDSPPGSFWVDADVADDMLSQKDSFAYSQFEGFPSQQIDWSRI